METQLPPLTALRCFEAAARRQSFTLAADELCLTPSAVSHQIKSLEAFLGNQLFVRAGRKMLLTDAGVSYFMHIKSAFDEILAATKALSGPKVGATLKVSVAPHFASVWLMPRFARFVRAHRNLAIQVFTYQHPTDFSDASVDCEIRYGHGKWLNLCSDFLLHDTLTPLCSPNLAGARNGPKNLNEIEKYTLIYTDSRRITWDTWASQFRVPGVERAPKLHVDRSSLAIDAAVAGLGIALESGLLASQAIRSGTLLVPLRETCTSDEAYYLVYPKSHAKSDGVKLFRSWLMNALADRGEDMKGPGGAIAKSKAA